jgi:hypothetical protein
VARAFLTTLMSSSRGSICNRKLFDLQHHKIHVSEAGSHK